MLLLKGTEVGGLRLPLSDEKACRAKLFRQCLGGLDSWGDLDFHTPSKG